MFAGKNEPVDEHMFTVKEKDSFTQYSDPNMFSSGHFQLVFLHLAIN